MDLTTVAYVRTLLQSSAAETVRDAVISQLISSISAAAESYCGRRFQRTSRVEILSPRAGAHSVSLCAYPITSITEIAEDSARVFGASTIMAPTTYSPSALTGRVHFDEALCGGPNTLRITYTGGIADTTTMLLSDGIYTDLAKAVSQQVILEMRRSVAPDVLGYTDASGGTTMAAPMDWLPGVRNVLDMHRNYGIDQ